MLEARWNTLVLSLFDDIMLLTSKCQKWPSRRIDIVKYLIPFTLTDPCPVTAYSGCNLGTLPKPDTNHEYKSWIHAAQAMQISWSVFTWRKSVFQFHFHLSWCGGINCQSGGCLSSCFLHYIYVNILWIYFLILTVMKLLHFIPTRAFIILPALHSKGLVLQGGQTWIRAAL